MQINRWNDNEITNLQKKKKNEGYSYFRINEFAL